MYIFAFNVTLQLGEVLGELSGLATTLFTGRDEAVACVCIHCLSH